MSPTKRTIPMVLKTVVAAAAVLAVASGCSWRPSMPELPDWKLPKIGLPDLPDLPDLNPFNNKPMGPAPDTSFGVAVLPAGGDVSRFHERAASFYSQLVNRRFNSILTYRDQALRAYFRDDDAFSDYYTDFSYSLELAAFEQNRPLRLDLTEFSLGEAGIAQVEILITGEDGKPLKYGETDYVRLDRWERHDGEWWLVPAKI
jgi:hypothetical protein